MTNEEKDDWLLVVLMGVLVVVIVGVWYHYCVVQTGSTAKEYRMERVEQ